jgi:hypothetical protein
VALVAGEVMTSPSERRKLRRCDSSIEPASREILAGAARVRHRRDGSVQDHPLDQHAGDLVGKEGLHVDITALA